MLNLSDSQMNQRAERRRKVNTDWGGIFDSRTVVNEPHTGVHFDSIGGRIAGRGKLGLRRDRRGKDVRCGRRRIDSRSRQSCVVLSRNLLPGTVPLLPSCEERISIQRKVLNRRHADQSLRTCERWTHRRELLKRGDRWGGVGREWQGEGGRGWSGRGERYPSRAQVWVGRAGALAHSLQRNISMILRRV